jgi:hypothetical protein
MINFFKKELVKLPISYVLVYILIYAFILIHYSLCICLFYNEAYKNMLFNINHDLSMFSIIYVGALLILLPLLFTNKFYSKSNFYTIYFSLLLGFFLNCSTIFFFECWTDVLVGFELIVIIYLMVFIQKKHMFYMFKELSITRKIIIVIFSVLNLYSFSGLVFMGGTVCMFQ